MTSNLVQKLYAKKSQTVALLTQNMAHPHSDVWRLSWLNVHRRDDVRHTTLLHRRLQTKQGREFIRCYCIQSGLQSGMFKVALYVLGWWSIGSVKSHEIHKGISASKRSGTRNK